jgi:hypothetical protein
LTKISARERLGLVFLFVILAQFDEGWQIFEHAFRGHENTSVAQIIQVFEALLCFDAWLMQDTFWKVPDLCGAKASAKASIEKLMHMCQKSIPNIKQNGWKFPKFHELLHIVDDMERFGAPRNFNAERPESLLIFAAKKPGRRAQKRHHGSMYELQSAQRVADSCLINAIHTRICSQSESSNIGNDYAEDQEDNMSNQSIFESTGYGTHCTLRRTAGPRTILNDPGISVLWHTQANLDGLQLSQALQNYLIKTFGSEVHCCTEYKRDVHTFRCHPSFQSQGAIYDWINVQFETGIFPCRLAMIVVLDGAVTPSEKYRLIIQPAIAATNCDSVLFREWMWTPEYYNVSPDTIVGPCFVISIKDDGSRILETKAYDMWAGEFTELYT